MRTLRHIAAGVLLSATAIVFGNDSNVSTTIAPGDDFFAYANDAWSTQTGIPSGMNRWTARNEIDAHVRQQLDELLAGRSSTASNVYERKVRDFLAAYLDRTKIEAKGWAPLGPLLKRIDAVNDKTELSRALGAEIRADVDPLNWGIYSSPNFFGIAIQQGIHGEKRRFVYLLQGGLGLSARDSYVLATPEAQALKRKYRSYVEHALSEAGFDRAADRATGIVGLETEIAKCHATDEASGPERNADNLWSRVDMTVKAPGIEWSVLLAAAQLSNQMTVVAWQPDAITCQAALVASQPLETWKDYLRFRAIDRYAEVLPRSVANEARALRDAAAGLPRSPPLDERAREATMNALTTTVGRAYVERYFSAESKARVQTIAANVIDVFAKRLATVDWLTRESKSLARAKLKSLYFGVGYPEAWPDEAGLAIAADDAFGNLDRATMWKYRSALATLNVPLDTRDWVLAPHRATAVLNFGLNSYNFPAALLQAPKFDLNESEAYNYGAIGAIVGHEVSHFVDTLGADYDANGGMRHWWSEKDRLGYDAATEPLIKQFDSYQPLPNASINGKTTLVENVADLAGLTVAFEAYRRSLGAKAGDPDFVRQHDRQFFLGFARSWRSELSVEALRTQIEKDNHAPDRYRIATVRNLDAWYKAFDVTPDQKLYLAPQDRVRVW